MKTPRRHQKEEANQTWQAPRLEGKVKNRGTQKTKKPKRAAKKKEPR